LLLTFFSKFAETSAEAAMVQPLELRPFKICKRLQMFNPSPHHSGQIKGKK